MRESIMEGSDMREGGKSEKESVVSDTERERERTIEWALSRRLDGVFFLELP